MRRRAFLNSLSLALIALLFFPSVPTLAAPPTPPVPSGSTVALTQLRARAGDVQVSTKQGLGTASFAGLPHSGSELRLPGTTVQQRALAFFAEYGELFGVRNPQVELEGKPAVSGLAGGAHVSFSQTYRGLPVFGGELRVH